MVHPITLTLQTGTEQTASEYEAQGRYVDMDKVRFFQGQPEKLGGWEQWNKAGDEITPVCRSILLWLDFNYNYWHAFGTSTRLWVFNQNKVRTNITPFVATGTLGANPFSTVSGSKTVTVHHVTHQVAADQQVIFAGATSFASITVDGPYRVQKVIDGDNYTIVDDETANATTTGGGAAVTYSYELPPGFIDLHRGGGWGIGTWGTGTWGTPRSSTTYLQFPRYWSLDKYGQYLLAMPSGGKLYQWNVNPTARAVAVANAPTSGLFMFVTSERIVVVLGADGELMTMRWSDDDDNTVWTPLPTNAANIRRLQEGSRLVAGCRLAQGINLVWTDTSVYLMQFTADNFIYSTRVVGTHCGLVGPGAFITVEGVAYWMSEFDFHMYNGAVVNVPKSSEVNLIFNDLTIDQRVKTNCHYNPRFNEVWWTYPSKKNHEPDHYVAVCLDDYGWIVGTLDRTAMAATSVNGNTEIFGVDATGVIFQHEGDDDNGDPILDADGTPLDWYLETGYLDLQDGNVGIDIDRYIPDFKRQTDAIDLTFTSKDYPTDVEELQVEETVIPENAGLVDLRHFGRQAKFKMGQTGVVGGDFRLGRQRLVLGETGLRE